MEDFNARNKTFFNLNISLGMGFKSHLEIQDFVHQDLLMAEFASTAIGICETPWELFKSISSQIILRHFSLL